LSPRAIEHVETTTSAPFNEFATPDLEERAAIVPVGVLARARGDVVAGVA
jgi:hypothetical protein